MSEFEKMYYEASGFWTEQALGDAGNTARIDFTAKQVPGDCRSLVDVGCGNGLFLKRVRELRPDLELCGVDRSQEALSYVDAKKEVADIVNLPFSDASFDCVVCSQVLEHISVPQYDKALAELCRISKRHLIVSVPYNEDLRAAFTTCPSCGSCFNRDLHLRSYSMKTASTLFSKFGFEHVASDTLVKTQKLIGIEFIQRWKTPSTEPVFESPICVVCGFENQGYTEYAAKLKPAASATVSPKSSKLKSLIKQLWPKQLQDGYWIVSRYVKSNTVPA